MKSFAKLNFFIIFTALAIFVSIGFSNPKTNAAINLKKSTYDAKKGCKDVNLLIKQKKVTTETNTLDLIFTNHSKKWYQYGEEPQLEIKINNIWYAIPRLENTGWVDIGYLIQPNNKRESPFKIKYFYGQLKSGNYRIVKQLFAFDTIASSVFKRTFAIVEFKIQ